MKTHVTAGGVLYDPRQQKVYLIYKKERDEWLLPKGHIEGGEGIEEAALREIKEETGYNGIELVKDGLLGKTEFEFELNGEKAFKVIYYYLAKLLEADFRETKERNTEGLEGKWFNLPEAIEKAKHEDTKKLLEKVGLFINRSKL
ncbi:MAG: NUDIX domain-containing protein [Patescibacteria group bacterium]